MTSYIFLNQVHFFAHHGVGGQETIAGNDFIIDLRLKTDIARAAETDDVANTVSYADVYEAVKEEMAIPSKLLFHDFPAVESIDLKLSKRNPPMGADLDTAGVEVHCDR